MGTELADFLAGEFVDGLVSDEGAVFGFIEEADVFEGHGSDCMQDLWRRFSLEKAAVPAKARLLVPLKSSMISFRCRAQANSGVSVDLRIKATAYPVCEV